MKKQYEKTSKNMKNIRKTKRNITRCFVVVYIIIHNNVSIQLNWHNYVFYEITIKFDFYIKNVKLKNVKEIFTFCLTLHNFLLHFPLHFTFQACKNNVASCM